MNEFLLSYMIIFICIITITCFLYFVSTEKFIKATSTMPPEIIISLTTSPTRINKIEPVITSIMNQTVKPDKIIINIPYMFKRTNETYDSIPTFLTDNELIHINRCEDIGPLTKILPSIEFAKYMDSVIISIDDDISYPENLIEKLVNESMKYPHCVIAGSGAAPYKKHFTELLEGYCGALYKKHFLIDFPVNDIQNYPRSCYLGDDLTISNFLSKKNIPIITLFDLQKDIYPHRLLDYSHNKDALHLSHENNTFNGHDYRSCIEFLKENNDYHMVYMDSALH